MTEGKALTKIEILDQWVKDLIFPSGNIDDFVHVTKSLKSEDQEIKEFCIYTNENKYKIFAMDRLEDDGYLGCQVVVRKVRAGEDWNRGNDLPDGPLNEETWKKILNSILNYELVKLSKYKKPSGIPEI